jgi:hypothetical protein
MLLSVLLDASSSLSILDLSDNNVSNAFLLDLSYISNPSIIAKD